MKPFDLDAAKCGDPIIVAMDDARNYCYIGQTKAGMVVIEAPTGVVYVRNGSDLFMAPKKRTVWVNLYNTVDGRISAGSELMHDTEARANAACSGSKSRIGGKAWPLEIED